MEYAVKSPKAYSLQSSIEHESALNSVISIRTITKEAVTYMILRQEKENMRKIMEKTTKGETKFKRGYNSGWEFSSVVNTS